jgi:hypothetical protein
LSLEGNEWLGRPGRVAELAGGTSEESAIEIERVTLDEARRFESTSPDGKAVQHVEFGSRQCQPEEWRISLQAPKDATDVSQPKTGGTWPKPSR